MRRFAVAGFLGVFLLTLGPAFSGKSKDTPEARRAPRTKSSPASAVEATSPTATVFIVHGIPGEDLGMDPDLPLDVSINGECAVDDLRFGDTAGPLEVPAGNLDVAAYPADPDNPCTGTALIEVLGLTLAEGEHATIILHLAEDGTATISKFENDVSLTERGRARVIVHHTAEAPPVDILFSRGGRSLTHSSAVPSSLIEGLANGEQAAVELRPGNWQLSITPVGEDEPVYGPEVVRFHPFRIYLLYAVGSPESGSFTVLQIGVERGPK